MEKRTKSRAKSAPAKEPASKQGESGAKSVPAAKNGSEKPGSTAGGIIEGEALEPIGTVRRELTRPDGTTVTVEVPVYPPFRLKERSAPRSAPPRGRKTPTLKRRKRAEGSGSES